MDAQKMLRAARRRAGLTQGQLASRAGTSQSTIAAYETGAKQPGVATLRRLVAAAGFEVAWHLEALPSPLGSVTHQVRESLGRGDEAEALRALAVLVTDLDRCRQGGRLGSVVADPAASTGDRRFDACIAGLVERAARRAGMRIPAWTASPDRFLDRWWFVSEYPSLHASAFVDSPAELANRGVFLHAASLESV